MERWWVDSALDNVELISEISIGWSPVTALGILGVLVDLTSLGQFSWAGNGSGFSLSNLLKGDVPAFAHLVVSKSENLWLSLLESSRILNQLIAIKCLIVDSGPVIHGTERSSVILMGLFNLNSSLIKSNLVSIISNVIIFFEKFNDSWGFWVLKIDSCSTSLGFFLSFLLLSSLRVYSVILLVVIFALVMVII